MNIARALNILKKKFELSPHTLSRLPKRQAIDWAQQVIKDGEQYRLTQAQHAFLVGEARSL
jgi:hypothetical protein